MNLTIMVFAVAAMTAPAVAPVQKKLVTELSKKASGPSRLVPLGPVSFGKSRVSTRLVPPTPAKSGAIR